MVDYKDFLTSASEMIEKGGSEIDLRNSMSRAYYGLYHLALNYADAVSMPPVSAFKGPTHEKLSSFFEGNLSADKDLRLKMRGIGYSLKQYHRKRCKADYCLDELVSKIEAEAQLKNCFAKADVLHELQKAYAA